MTARGKDNTLYLYSTFHIMLTNPFTNISSLILLSFLLGSECQGPLSVHLVTD